MFDIPCIIFAGGKSSRMGEDKSLLPFGDFDTLTEYQYHKLKKSFKDVYISCKEREKFNFEASFIEDISTDNIFAPTTGFVSIFEYFDEEKLFVISVDTPFVTNDVISTIINLDNNNQDATIAKTDFGLHPMCGIYHKSLKNKFTKMLQENNHKLGFLLKSSNTKYVYFDDDEAFKNLNYFHEYTNALLNLKSKS